MKTALVTVVFTSLLIFLAQGASSVFAQLDFKGPSQVSVNIEVLDKEAKAGDIVSRTKEGIIRSKIAYDTDLYGVVADNPPVSLNRASEETRPIVSYGEVEVFVSTENGKISQGDLITSSVTPGVGQKATEAGYSIGKALKDYSESTPGKIPVFVNIQYRTIGGQASGFIGQLLTGLGSGVQRPENFPIVLRYIFASVLGAGTFLLGFVSFVRILRTGIESVGRNPLAKSSIQLAMVINALAVALLTAGGLGLAVFLVVYF